MRCFNVSILEMYNFYYSQFLSFNILKWSEYSIFSWSELHISFYRIYWKIKLTHKLLDYFYCFLKKKNYQKPSVCHTIMNKYLKKVFILRKQGRETQSVGLAKEWHTPKNTPLSPATKSHTGRARNYKSQNGPWRKQWCLWGKMKSYHFAQPEQGSRNFHRQRERIRTWEKNEKKVKQYSKKGKINA